MRTFFMKNSKFVYFWNIYSRLPQVNWKQKKLIPNKLNFIYAVGGLEINQIAKWNRSLWNKENIVSVNWYMGQVCFVFNLFWSRFSIWNKTNVDLH